MGRITDPDTGAGAYKIAGGGNGSFTFGDYVKEKISGLVAISGKLAGYVAAIGEAIFDILTVLFDEGSKNAGRIMSKLFLLMGLLFTLDEIVNDCRDGGQLANAIVLGLVLTVVAFIFSAMIGLVFFYFLPLLGIIVSGLAGLYFGNLMMAGLKKRLCDD